MRMRQVLCGAEESTASPQPTVPISAFTYSPSLPTRQSDMRGQPVAIALRPYGWPMTFELGITVDQSDPIGERQPAPRPSCSC